MSDFETNVEKFVNDVNKALLDGNLEGLTYVRQVKSNFAKNYVKISVDDYNKETHECLDHTSVYCFIVKNENDKKFQLGDILKPAGWKAPARNFARGNVFNDDYFPIGLYGI